MSYNLPRKEQMKPNFLASKRIWLASGILVIIAVAVVAFWLKPPPQIINLPNGDQLEFAGVTYSTNTLPPGLGYRLAALLPRSTVASVRKHLWVRMPDLNVPLLPSESPQLVVWFRKLGTNLPGSGLEAGVSRLADSAGIEGGTGARFSQWDAWTFRRFSSLPRRSRMIECIIYPLPGGPNATNPVGRVTFVNPAYGLFPQWQPEPVPTAKSTGDLEVRLENFVIFGRSPDRAKATMAVGPLGNRIFTQDVSANIIAGVAGEPWLLGQPSDNGQVADTGFRITLNPKKNTNEIWVFQDYELTDATGNMLQRAPFSQTGWTIGGIPLRQRVGDKATLTEILPGTLWPDESAWQLKVELKRAEGYDPADIVTFKHVPVPPPGTNDYSHLMTNYVGDVQVVITGFERQPQFRRITGTSLINVMNAIRVELPGKPGGVAVDVLSVTSDSGEVIRGIPFGSGSSYALNFTTLPANATNLDVTLLVQKTRTVSFLVKPPSNQK